MMDGAANSEKNLPLQVVYNLVPAVLRAGVEEQPFLADQRQQTQVNLVGTLVQPRILADRAVERGGQGGISVHF